MVNIGSSVIRRESRSADDVLDELRANGWSKTDEVHGNIHYLENSGFSLTVIDGPLATTVIPSGPLRGRLFGTSGLEVSMDRNLMDVGSLTDRQQSMSASFGGRLRTLPFRGNNGQTEDGSSQEDSEDSSNSNGDGSTGGEPQQPNRKNTRSSGSGDFV